MSGDLSLVETTMRQDGVIWRAVPRLGRYRLPALREPFERLGPSFGCIEHVRDDFARCEAPEPAAHRQEHQLSSRAALSIANPGEPLRIAIITSSSDLERRAPHPSARAGAAAVRCQLSFDALAHWLARCHAGEASSPRRAPGTRPTDRWRRARSREPPPVDRRRRRSGIPALSSGAGSTSITRAHGRASVRERVYGFRGAMRPPPRTSAARGGRRRLASQRSAKRNSIQKRFFRRRATGDVDSRLPTTSAASTEGTPQQHAIDGLLGRITCRLARAAPDRASRRRRRRPSEPRRAWKPLLPGSTLIAAGRRHGVHAQPKAGARRGVPATERGAHAEELARAPARRWAAAAVPACDRTSARRVER